MPKTPDEYFRDWEGHAFGYGYGSGEPHVLPALKEFFTLVQSQDGEPKTYDYTDLETALTPVVAWLFINRLCQLGVVEYGTSPRYVWLSPKGARLQAFCAPKSDDDLVRIVCDHDEEYVACYPDACNCGPRGYEKARVCQNPFWLDRL